MQPMKTDERENINKPVTSKEIDLVIENLPKNESPGPEASLVIQRRCLHFINRRINASLCQILLNSRRDGTLSS